MRPRSSRGLTASPVLVGSATVLAVLIGVYLAYNANEGLPFVPSRQLRVELRSAAGLVIGDDVRVNGERAGQVTAIEPRVGPSGPVAVATLKLDAAVRLPADSAAMVRQRSFLGAKYLELVPGRARAALAGRATIPVARTRTPVDLNDVLATFDPHTRSAVRGVLYELGDGLAGRGVDVNAGLGELPAVAKHLGRATATLVDPAARLPAFIRGLERTTTALIPVRDNLAELVQRADSTFAATSRARSQLRQALARAPAVTDSVTTSLRAATPVLRDAGALLAAAQPGLRQLPATARSLPKPLQSGTRAMTQVPGLSRGLGAALRSLRPLTVAPRAFIALSALRRALPPINRLLATLVPFQVRCNYLGLWFRNVDSTISEGDRWGNWFRNLPLPVPDEMMQRRDPAPNLHFNGLPDTGAGGECEAGREPYLPGRRIGRVPGNQGDRTEDTARPPLEDGRG